MGGGPVQRGFHAAIAGAGGCQNSAAQEHGKRLHEEANVRPSPSRVASCLALVTGFCVTHTYDIARRPLSPSTPREVYSG